MPGKGKKKRGNRDAPSRLTQEGRRSLRWSIAGREKKEGKNMSPAFHQREKKGEVPADRLFEGDAKGGKGSEGCSCSPNSRTTEGRNRTPSREPEKGLKTLITTWGVGSKFIFFLFCRRGEEKKNPASNPAFPVSLAREKGGPSLIPLLHRGRGEGHFIIQPSERKKETGITSLPRKGAPSLLTWTVVREKHKA